MALVNSGRNFLAEAVMNDSTPTFFDNGNAYLGVGTGSGAVAATDTQATFTAGVWKGMEATYPQRTDNVLTFRASFGAGDANQAWNEWGIANAASGGQLLCRKVESQGTKSGGTWVFTVTVPIGIGS
jgi:hypothetical protein